MNSFVPGQGKRGSLHRESVGQGDQPCDPLQPPHDSAFIDSAKAIELMKPASAYDKGNTGALYLRGLAYLKNKQGAEAAQEFEKIIALS